MIFEPLPPEKCKIKKRWFYWHIRNPLWYFWHKNFYPKLKGYKPMKWGIYLPLLSSKYWANRLQEIQFGQMVWGKFTFILTVVNFVILISLKWDFDPTNYLIPIGILCAFLMWYTGRFLEKKGVRKHYREAEFKDVRLK